MHPLLCEGRSKISRCTAAAAPTGKLHLPKSSTNVEKKFKIPGESLKQNKRNCLEKLRFNIVLDFRFNF